MPVIHKSTIKRARQAEKRNQRNRALLSSVKGITKKAQTAVDEKNLDAVKTSFREAQAALSKAAAKGIIKSNTASRRIARLAKRINALTAPSS
jgi:small subunit ribosomal protein S20